MLPADVVAKLSECASTNFTSARDWWSTFVSYATALVVLGLVLEGPELVHELIPIGRKIAALFSKSAVAAPTHDIPDWVKVVAFLGWLLIVAGVGGEEFGGTKVDSLNTHIQECGDTKTRAATLEAGDAKTSAESASVASSRAQTSADAAGGDAKAARGVARSVASKADKLDRQLAGAQVQLDSVEAKRAELEKSLINLAVCNAPRVIPIWQIGNAKTSVDPLKAFAGREAIIQFIPDAEARRAAISIAASIQSAGWKIIQLSAADGIDDGVQVQTYSYMAGSNQERIRQWQSHLRSSDAAYALVDFLHSYNWQARWAWGLPDSDDIPPDGLKIRVGLYPPVTFISPPGSKDLADTMAKAEQQREAQSKEAEMKQDEQMLKRLTPQQVMEFKARKEEWDKEQKQWTERYSGPCHPLNSLDSAGGPG